jgi:hypothetical protein
MDITSIVDTYKDKYNEIKNTLEKIFLARNYKLINSLQFHVNRAATMYLLVLTTDLSFLDIHNLIMKGENSQMYRDLVQYRYKICCIVKFGMSVCDTNKRYTAKKQRLPIWLTKENELQIKAMYTLASSLNKSTGVQWHVDHIIPLQGKNVSGLHVPWNLQILPASINRSKGNKF